MNNIFKYVVNFFRSMFTRSKKVITLPQHEEEYDGWLGV